MSTFELSQGEKTYTFDLTGGVQCDGEDCGDTEGGLCCASGVSVALLATATHSEQALLPMLESGALTPTHLLLPRAQGPPPTPPPIG